MDLTEKKVSSAEVFSGNLLHVFRDEIALPNGKPAVREYIRHVGAACVVPMNEKGEVYMVRQFRYPFGRPLLEVPAGKLDTKEEDPAHAALRELSEETGIEAAELTYLGEFYPTCAYSDEVIHIYLAKGLTFAETHPDDDEFVETAVYPLKTLVDMVMRGEIEDGKTQVALLKTAIALRYI